ncbi:unnamed protein product [Boreogadus saida]
MGGDRIYELLIPLVKDFRNAPPAPLSCCTSSPLPALLYLHPGFLMYRHPGSMLLLYLHPGSLFLLYLHPGSLLCTFNLAPCSYCTSTLAPCSCCTFTLVPCCTFTLVPCCTSTLAPCSAVPPPWLPALLYLHPGSLLCCTSTLAPCCTSTLASCSVPTPWLPALHLHPGSLLCISTLAPCTAVPSPWLPDLHLHLGSLVYLHPGSPPRTARPQQHKHTKAHLGSHFDPNAPPVLPPWHRVTGTWRAFGASAQTTPRLLWRPPSPVSPAGSCLKRGSSRHLFFSPAVDLADAIDMFRAGAPDLDDDGGIIDVDDDASMDDVFGDSASGFSRSRVTTATVVQREKPRRMADLFGEIMGEAAAIKGIPMPAPPLAPVSDDMQGECFRSPSSSRRVTSAPCFRLCSTCLLLPVGTLRP